MKVRVNDDVSPFAYHHPSGIAVMFVPNQVIDLGELGLDTDRDFWKAMGSNVTPLVEDASKVPGRLRNVKLPKSARGNSRQRRLPTRKK